MGIFSAPLNQKGKRHVQKKAKHFPCHIMAKVPLFQIYWKRGKIFLEQQLLFLAQTLLAKEFLFTY